MHTRAQQQQQQLCKGARPRLVRTNDPKVPDSVEDNRTVVVVKDEVSEVVTRVDPKEEVVATATSNSIACKVEQCTTFTIEESPASPDLPSSPEVGENTPESMWTPN